MPKDFPRQDTKGVRRSRAWKPFQKETHPPRAHSRPEAQVTHKPKVNTGPRVSGTNDKGPNKGWVPKVV